MLRAGAPAPTPTVFPHPHCSVIFDPAGYVVGEVAGMLFAAATGQPIDPNGPVLVGGRMASVTGDSAAMPISHLVIPPGTAFADIPDTWFCPVCGARKKDFVPYE